jgi:ferrochelatase
MFHSSHSSSSSSLAGRARVDQASDSIRSITTKRRSTLLTWKRKDQSVYARQFTVLMSTLETSAAATVPLSPAAPESLKTNENISNEGGGNLDLFRDVLGTVGPADMTIDYHYSPDDDISNQNDDMSAGSTRNIKLGVLLLNLGGPESMGDVEGFLYNLFADPDIIRLPTFLSALQKPIAYVIAKRRAPKSSEAYRSIGGGSPIVKYTQAQADSIEKRLVAKGYDAKCYFAMRYWNPYTEEVLEKIQADGINTLVIVPLYPQYSISTSGSSLRLLQDIFYKNPDVWGSQKVMHTVVPAWYYRPGYINCVAKLILDEVVSYSDKEVHEGLHILFSAHGVPQSYIQAGDPYQRQIEDCVRLVSDQVSKLLLDEKTRPPELSPEQAAKLAGGILQRAKSASSPAVPMKMTPFGPIPKSLLNPDARPGEIQFHLSFQSRVGPVQWLK